MLRLLQCVDTLDTVTSTQLWTFVAEQELMDYVSMRLCLHKLIAAGEMELGRGALGEQLLMTDRGREALSLFGSRLPGDVRRRIAGAAPEFRERVLRNQQVRAAYEIARPNDYRLNLSVYEGDLPTVRLRMETHNRSLAARTIRRFTPHASQMTTYLYGLAERALSLPAAESAAPPPDVVTEHSSTEYTAKVEVTGRKARFEVELLLPTREAAEKFIASLADPEEAQNVANRLTDLVSGARRIAMR